MEKQKNMCFKLVLHNGLFRLLKPSLQWCNVKNHTTPFSSNRSHKWLLTQDASSISNCMSFNQTPTKDQHLKFAITHGNGTLNIFSPHWIWLTLQRNSSNKESKAALSLQPKTYKTSKNLKTTKFQHGLNPTTLQLVSSPWQPSSYSTSHSGSINGTPTYPLQPLDVGLNHLNQKECLEYLKLKQEIAEYEQHLWESHNNIIRVGDLPENINMSE